MEQFQSYVTWTLMMQLKSLDILLETVDLFCLVYPLVNIQKAIEHGPVEIVSFPMKNGDFP